MKTRTIRVGAALKQPRCSLISLLSGSKTDRQTQPSHFKALVQSKKKKKKGCQCHQQWINAMSLTKTKQKSCHAHRLILSAVRMRGERLQMHYFLLALERTTVYFSQNISVRPQYASGNSDVHGNLMSLISTIMQRRI